MRFQLYSQLLRLDLSNEHLLQMYYVLYYEIHKEEKELLGNIARLIELREKIKLELRSHLFSLKHSLGESKVSSSILDYLPVFLKIESLAKNTFTNANWKECYDKERRNLKLYYGTLYNQNISSSTMDILLKQKKRLESLTS